MLAFIGYKFLEFIALILPYAIAYPIARLAARLSVAANINLIPLKKNISMVLDLDLENPLVHKTAIAVYEHWLQNVTDFLKHKLISKQKLKERVQIDGLENLREALKKGKGAVIFTAHIGNFEWGACRIAVEFDNTWGMGMERKCKPLNNFFESKRLSKNLNTIYSNHLLNIFRILKNNGIVAIPTDWDPHNKSVPVNFFGKKAKIPYGPVYAALKSGAPLLPSFIHRKDKYTHSQIIGKPLDLVVRGDKQKMLEINRGKMITVLEEYIKKHIDQWEMFHDIWDN